GGIFLLGVGGAFAQTTTTTVPRCFNGGDSSMGCSGGCASDSPTCASDDPGCVPDTKDHLKCSDATVKAFQKAIACVAKCHSKLADAFFKGKPYDEEACEEVDPAKGKAAHQRYTQAETVILSKGICPPCLDQAHQDALGAGVIAQVEAGNALAYPCP